MTLSVLVAALAWTGSMRIIERPDPLTDRPSVYAVVGTSSQYLAMGCEVENSGQLRVTAKFDRYVGSARRGVLMGGVDIDYRFDKAAPGSARWASRSDLVMAESDEANPMPFVLQARGSSSIFLRATNTWADRDPVEMSFEFTGSSEAINTMLRRCGLNPDGSRPGRDTH